MNINYYNPYVRKELELYHHGIFGMKWGKKNGPPYPLDASDHSASEKKAGWRKSLDNDGVSKTKEKKPKKESKYKKAKREFKESRVKVREARKEYRTAKKEYKRTGTTESKNNLRYKKQALTYAKFNRAQKYNTYYMRSIIRNLKIEAAMYLAVAATPAVLKAGKAIFDKYSDYQYKNRPDIVSTSSREFRNAMEAGYTDMGNLPAVINRRR